MINVVTTDTPSWLMVEEGEERINPIDRFRDKASKLFTEKYLYAFQDRETLYEIKNNCDTIVQLIERTTVPLKFKLEYQVSFFENRIIVNITKIVWGIHVYTDEDEFNNDFRSTFDIWYSKQIKKDNEDTK